MMVEAHRRLAFPYARWTQLPLCPPPIPPIWASSNQCVFLGLVPGTIPLDPTFGSFTLLEPISH
jgi:hypothetical protein